MPQVKIYGLRSHLDSARSALSDAIHAAMVEQFGCHPDKRFQRFFPMAQENFIYSDGRSERYTIIEIIAFEGRPDEQKRALIAALYEKIGRATGVDALDIEITLLETPKVNWGLRGSSGDQLFG